jgi:tetratricopeptide (TPR) repeat protein
MKSSDHMYRDIMSAAAACILGDVYVREDKTEEALASYRRAWHVLQERRTVVGHARLCVRAQAGLATAYALQGDRERARGLLLKAMETAETCTSIKHCVPMVSLAEQCHAIAAAHIAVGAWAAYGLPERQDAAGFLKRAVSSGWRDSQWLRADPLFEPIRNSSEFAEIVECADSFPSVEFTAD